MIPLTSVNGCDSIIEVDLSYYDPAEELIDLTLCTGDQLIVNGTVYDETNPSGIDTIFAGSINSCDSMITIDLSFVNSFNINDTESICQGDSILIEGQWIKDEGNYPLNLISAQGCDSIVDLEIQFFPPAIGTLQQTLCSGDNIIINGTIYDESNPTGQEPFPNASINSCDSLLNIELDFVIEFMIDIGISICQGDSINIDGAWVKDEGTYPESLISSQGCDSTNMYILDYFQVGQGLIDMSLCEDESIVINNVTYDILNPSGQETLMVASIDGCDSLVNINLSFDSVYAIDIPATICIGDSIFIGGEWRFAAGMYTDNLISIDGCDSLVTTNLIVETCGDLINTVVIDNACALEANGSLCFTIGGNSLPIVAAWTNTSTGETGGFPINVLNEEICLSELSSGNYTVQFLDSTGAEIETNSYTIVDLNSELSGMINIISDLNCAGDQNASIMAEITGGSGDYTFNWDQNLGNSNTLNNLASGAYTVTATDSELCQLILDITLDEPSQIGFDFNFANSSCAGANDGFIELSNIVAGTSNFSVFADGTEIFSPYELENLDAGNFTIGLVNDNGCSTSQTITITNEDTALLNSFTSNYNIVLSESVDFEAVFGSNVDSVIWSPANDGISCTDCLLPNFSPQETTSYTLTIFDINGCSQQIQVIVNVSIPDIEIFVPNIFSPNSDGVNDYFTIGFGSSEIVSYNLIIFDRWGNQVFNRALIPNADEGWDGKLNTQEVAQGVYMYLMQYNDPNRGLINLSGDITILK